MIREERRKRKRVPVAFDITISVDGRVVEVQTFNVSLTGMLCSSNASLPENQECLVTMQLTPDISICIQGKVVRTDPRETALVFLSMDEESFLHLKKLIQHNACNPDQIDRELRIPAFPS